MPSHYLNQCWNIVNWAPRKKLQLNFNGNSYIFIQQNPFQNVIWKSRPFCLGLNVLNNADNVGHDNAIIVFSPLVVLTLYAAWHITPVVIPYWSGSDPLYAAINNVLRSDGAHWQTRAEVLDWDEGWVTMLFTGCLIKYGFIVLYFAGIAQLSGLYVSFSPYCSNLMCPSMGKRKKGIILCAF